MEAPPASLASGPLEPSTPGLLAHSVLVPTGYLALGWPRVVPEDSAQHCRRAGACSLGPQGALRSQVGRTTVGG